MSFISYIVTYRDDGSAERRANLVAVLNWVRTLPDVEIIVIEQAKEPTPPLADQNGVRWVFCYNPGPFNKSWGFNVGARQSNAPVLAFGDADVICAEAWQETIRRLREGMPIVKPYHHIVDLTADESAQVRGGEWDFRPLRSENALPNREEKGEYIVFAGGLFLLHREVFNRISGFDERFLGWGGEDDAMTMRLAACGEKMRMLNLAPALHLWHPRRPETTFKQPCYKANCTILADYRRYDIAQMEGLWVAQRQTMGEADKYRAEFNGNPATRV